MNRPATPGATSSPADSKLSRRTLFAGAGTAGALAAAASLVPGAREAAAEAAALPQPAPERGGGYALSEHVKRYYKTTRL
ncbi:MAG: formate dehydrogenase [Comamonadaceae bacterium]|nr:MAG: formate dehydrogenase [Comamonadaceae bacterium]